MTAVNVGVGDQVTAGQVLATVAPLDGGVPVAVKGTHAGTVVELNVDLGNIVNPTTSIASIEQTQKPMVAVLFLPAALGKQVRVGMEAEVSPATLSKQNDGYLAGTVSWVAPFPSTPDSMARLLTNQTLVQTFFQAAGGLPLEVHVALTPNPHTPSGYEWSSGDGPNFAVTTGTLISNQIIVARQPPIDLVLPRLRSLL